MGCSSSQAAKVVTAETKENGIVEQNEADKRYPPAEAFEVLLDDESDSIIRKHPPKRLQRLVDAPTTQTTIQELEEKLANAEVRRNQFLKERISKASNDDGDGNVIEKNPVEDQNIVTESNEAPTETSLRTSTDTPPLVDDSNLSNDTAQEDK